MKKISQFLFTTVLAALLFTSCDKTPAYVQADGGIRYESDGEIDLRSNFSSGVNTGYIYIDNASLYEDLVGNVMASALSSTTDGEPNAVRDLQFSNLTVANIEIYSAWQGEALRDIVKSCVLVLERGYVGSSDYKKTTLGTLSGYANGALTFTLNSSDLTEIAAEKPESMRFELEYNDFIADEINVTYDIVFDCQYKYENPQVK